MPSRQPPPQDEEEVRTPDEREQRPDRQLERRGERACRRVGQHEKRGTREHGERQEDAVIGPDKDAHPVRHHEPDEAHEAADAGRRGRQERGKARRRDPPSANGQPEPMLAASRLSFVSRSSAAIPTRRRSGSAVTVSAFARQAILFGF